MYTQLNTFYFQPNEMVSTKEVMTLSLYLMNTKNKMKIINNKKVFFMRISPKLQPLSRELTDTFMNSWYFWNLGDLKMSF